jgi:hypothetical protein
MPSSRLRQLTRVHKSLISFDSFNELIVQKVALVTLYGDPKELLGLDARV